MHLRPQLFTRCRYLCDGECAKLWLCNESLYDACLSAFAFVLLNRRFVQFFHFWSQHTKKKIKNKLAFKDVQEVTYFLNML